MSNFPLAGAATLDRNRFVAFALTAAELLVEVDPETGISFATGAFRARFGEAPEAFLGRPAETLIAPEDRTEFVLAMGVLAAGGRLPPRILRVNDSGRSEMIVSGLAPSSPGQRVFLTLAENPRARAEQEPILPETLSQRAERTLREGSGGTLALLQLPQGADAAMDRTPALRSALTRELGPAEELARGRVGILASGGDGLATLAASAERILAAHGVGGSVTARSVALDAGSLSAVQATRALRHVLTAFSRDGVPGLDASGATAGLDAAVNQLKSDAASLRRVLTSRRFNLAFQPIVDLADGAVHHFEALLRPPAELPGELARPDGFVRCAEAVGMSDALDLAVCERVVQTLATSSTSIALNLSGLSVQSPEFRDALLGMLDAAPGVFPRLLVEITESAEIENEEEAEHTLAALRERGVKLCLDDFGAGAAAFRYLRAFRVDWVKIDGTYIMNATRSARDRAFIQSMVNLSVSVGAKVIAERIETEAEAALMRSLGVHCGQGWHHGRPAPLPRAAAAKREGVKETWV